MPGEAEVKVSSNGSLSSEKERHISSNTMGWVTLQGFEKRKFEAKKELLFAKRD